MTSVGMEYAGNVAKTVSGRTCQRWDAQSPHEHTQSASNLPEDTLSNASNFCRNPSYHGEGPWCYTTDPGLRWEICQVDMCPDGCNSWEQWCPDRGCLDNRIACDECQPQEQKCPNEGNPKQFRCISELLVCSCPNNHTQCLTGDNIGECMLNAEDCNRVITTLDMVRNYAIVVVPCIIVIICICCCVKRCRNRKKKPPQQGPVMVQFNACGAGDPNATAQLLPPGQQQQQPQQQQQQQQPHPPQQPHPHPAGLLPPTNKPYPVQQYAPQGSYQPQAYAPQGSYHPPQWYPPGNAPQGNVPTYPPTSMYPSGATNAPGHPPANAGAAHPPGQSHPPHAGGGDSNAPTSPGASPAPRPVDIQGHSLEGAYTSPEYHGFDPKSLPPPPSYESVSGHKE